ncbi:MAG: DUF1127 domain-containing protein [Pseudomonadota bacterium]
MEYAMTVHTLPFARRRRSPDVFGLVGLWLRTARERRALARLDAARLADLGLTAREASAEARRPFWDL